MSGCIALEARVIQYQPLHSSVVSRHDKVIAPTVTWLCVKLGGYSACTETSRQA
ncbi:hypothetical protein PISMIDRAFT_683079 [Pisolithus microcarpus 441]|uniref:Uncharacterized protein n=1 Tax=Pisolithus microcarpus 441 TaxID=765257 RepID=A0A0C9YZP9_9AGAM|nr:hypothetical protein PISMIDRAFT_683079 [Pisolithus microcarpus 441]